MWLEPDYREQEPRYTGETTMHKFTMGILIALMAMTVSSCLIEGPAVPYVYLPT